jgi:hypothetical protein
MDDTAAAVRRAKDAVAALFKETLARLELLQSHFTEGH